MAPRRHEPRRSRKAIEGSRSAPASQAWVPESTARRKGLAPDAIRCAATSSKSRTAAPRLPGQSPRQNSATTALLLARRAGFHRLVLGAWTTKSLRWGRHRSRRSASRRARRRAPRQPFSAASAGSRPASPRPRRSWRPARPKRPRSARAASAPPPRSGARERAALGNLPRAIGAVALGGSSAAGAARAPSARRPAPARVLGIEPRRHGR